MLPAQQSQDLMRVGPGTVMGELMREYWIPAAMSSELVAGGAPMRMMLLGEKLVAFRSPDGSIGVMDHECPHRCASLFMGRNEEGGIRCAYHGWKFDTAGNCIDMPNVPADRSFASQIKAQAYKAVDKFGAIWVYMGKREVAPPLPSFDVFGVPEDEIQVRMLLQPCNYMQSLEGTIDTTHFTFLHCGTVDADALGPKHPQYEAVATSEGTFEVWNTPVGVQGGCYRPAVAPDHKGDTYWRMAHFLMPFWSLTAPGNFYEDLSATCSVPLDDTHSFLMGFRWIRPGRDPADRFDTNGRISGQKITGLEEVQGTRVPNGTGWFDRWRIAEIEDNDWNINRETQMAPWPHGSFSGLPSLQVQDAAMVVSMGRMVNHTKEHLAPTDRLIMMSRRRLLDSAYALRDHGTVPPGVDNPEYYSDTRSGQYYAAPTLSGQTSYEQEIKSVVQPPSRHAAE